MYLWWASKLQSLQHPHGYVFKIQAFVSPFTFTTTACISTTPPHPPISPTFLPCWPPCTTCTPRFPQMSFFLLLLTRQIQLRQLRAFTRPGIPCQQQEEEDGKEQVGQQGEAGKDGVQGNQKGSVAGDIGG